MADLGLIELPNGNDIRDEELSHVLSLHPVVHGLLREDGDVQRRRADYYGLNLRMLLAATRDWDPDLPESWAVWTILAPHAIEVARATLLGPSRLDDHDVIGAAVELARLTSRYLIAKGLLRPAHAFLPPIIANYGSFGLHEDDREILSLRHEQGRIALESGDPAAAEAELRQVVMGREHALGPDHPDTWASRHKLAKAILDQSRWEEAERLLWSIVTAENTLRGPEHSDTMVVRHSLARAILAQDRAAEAEIMLREILKVRNRLWSPRHPETLFVRHTLARSLLQQGKWPEAESEARNALSEVPDRQDAPVLMQLRHALTIALLSQGRLREAFTEGSGLLEDRRRVLGPTHPQTAQISNDLERIRALIGVSDQSPVEVRHHGDPGTDPHVL